MKTLIRIGMSASLPLLLLAGCKAPGAPMSDTTTADVSAVQKASSLFSDAKVASSTTEDGMANLRMSLRILDPKAPGYKVQALPYAGWQKATVMLYSQDQSTGFNANKHMAEVERGDFTENDFTESTETLVNPDGMDGDDKAFFNHPTGLTIDRKGNIYLANTDHGSVVKMDQNGDKRQVLAEGMGQPRGIAVDNSGNIYVAQAGNQWLTVLVPNGESYDKYDLKTEDLGPNGKPYGWSEPHGIAVDSEGTVYVADTGNDQVAVLRPTSGGIVGRDEFKISRFRGKLDEPRAVAVGPQGNVFVADKWRITEFTADGTQMGVATCQSQPRGLAVDASGRLYVSNFDQGVEQFISVYEKQYDKWRKIDSVGTTLSYDYPGELEVDADGQIVIANTNSDQIFKIKPAADGLEAAFDFPPLRPGSGYKAQLFLTGQNGYRYETLADLSEIAIPKPPMKSDDSLAGSQVLPEFSLRAGRNDLVFNVTVNGEQFHTSIEESRAGNEVRGNAITEDDVVTLSTGMANNQPGVQRLVIELSGPCYDHGRSVATIGVLEEGAKDSWNTFKWFSNKQGPDYRPGRLTLPEGNKKIAAPSAKGLITVRAFGPHGQEIASTSFPVIMYKRPQVNVILK